MAKTKQDLHLLRKLNHMIPGVLLIIITAFELIQLDILKKIIFSLYLLISFLEVYRLSNNKVNRLFYKYFYFLLRKTEVRRPTTTTFYLFSVNILYYFFQIEIVYIGLLVLSIGDPLASIVGISFKDHYKNQKFNNNKSLFGSLTLSIVSFVSSFITLIIFGYTMKVIMIYSLVLFIIIFMVESFIENIDDNLYLPLVPAILAILFL